MLVNSILLLQREVRTFSDRIIQRGIDETKEGGLLTAHSIFSTATKTYHSLRILTEPSSTKRCGPDPTWTETDSTATS